MLGGRLPEWVQCPYCGQIFKRKGFVGRSGIRVRCINCGRYFYLWEAKELFIRDKYFSPIPVFASRSKRARKVKKRLEFLKKKQMESL